jgi:hypothetical protein
MLMGDEGLNYIKEEARLGLNMANEMLEQHHHGTTEHDTYSYLKHRFEHILISIEVGQ